MVVKLIRLSTLLITFLALSARSEEFYVSPEGRPGGDGSRNDPWDLATALSHPRVVRPGDTIWLRGGDYRGAFTSNLTGAERAPILVRQYPEERVTLDGGTSTKTTLTINGAWTWYWGFEVTDSDPKRVTQISGSSPSDLTRGDGIALYGPNTKLLNLVVHDAGDGIGFWERAENAEVYGCITYYNGWQGPDRGHGHGLYIQNRTGAKRISDVISFNNFATGMKAFAEQGYAVGIDFDGVVAFNNGALRSGRSKEWNLLVGTSVVPADHISVTGSYFYHTPNTIGGNLAFGYVAKNNGAVVVKNNYAAGGNHTIEMKQWRSAAVTGNTFYLAALAGFPSQGLAALENPAGADTSAYQWNENTYFDGGAPWRENRLTYTFSFNDRKNSFGGGKLTYGEWKDGTGFDQSSRYSIGKPSGVSVFVRPNLYESGRAHIIVYNWDLKDAVEVDLSAILNPGDRFEIRDAQNYFGDPVLRGTYSGEPIPLSMKLTLMAQPIGNVPTIPPHTAPELGVFVLRRLPSAVQPVRPPRFRSR